MGCLFTGIDQVCKNRATKDSALNVCQTYIYRNVKAKHGKKTEPKKLIWWLAWRYNEAEYKERLDCVFNYDSEVFEDVMKTNPTSWVRAFYRIGNFCEDVENNSTESFNSSIVQAREKPLVPMLETIARLAMARIAARDAKATSHKHICTPYVIEYLQEQHKKAAECVVHISTNNMWLVKLEGCYFRISLD